jgi:hypothetical protein
MRNNHKIEVKNPKAVKQSSQFITRVHSKKSSLNSQFLNAMMSCLLASIFTQVKERSFEFHPTSQPRRLISSIVEEKREALSVCCCSPSIHQVGKVEE